MNKIAYSNNVWKGERTKKRNGVLWFNDHDLFVNRGHESSKDVNQLETRVTSTITFF